MNIFQSYPDVLTVTEVRLMLGGRTSKRLVYRLLGDGSLISRKIGREYRVTKESVIAYLTSADTSLCPENRRQKDDSKT